MNLDQLRVFVVAMRQGGFAAAARESGRDASSVSRLISGLERELGGRLFNRSTRRFSPTELGQSFYERVEPLLAQLESAGVEASDRGARPRGTLRITAPVGFALDSLVSWLPEFGASYPELKYELLITDHFLDLVEERVDIAIRLGRLPESSLVAKKLFELEHILCASPSYLRKRGTPRAPEDLERHDCLKYPVTGYPAWRFRRAGEPPREVRVHARVTTANGIALRECALAGMGVLLLPRWHVERQLRSGALVRLLAEYEWTLSEFGVAAWMVYPSRSYLPRKVRAFTDFVLSRVKAASSAAR